MRESELTMSQPWSRYLVLTLRHSWIIFFTFRRHSSTARSYPALSSSFGRSGSAGSGTGSKGKIASARLNFLAEKCLHILLMLCWGGSLRFFFFFWFVPLLFGLLDLRGSSDSDSEDEL